MARASKRLDISARGHLQNGAGAKRPLDLLMSLLFLLTGDLETRLTVPYRDHTALPIRQTVIAFV